MAVQLSHKIYSLSCMKIDHDASSLKHTKAELLSCTIVFVAISAEVCVRVPTYDARIVTASFFQ